MQSKLDVFNLSLSLLGQSPLGTVDEDNEIGRVCNLVYPSSLRSFLVMHPWDVALRRAVLSVPNSVAPAWGFDYSYPLPLRCIRVLQTADSYGYILPEGDCNIEADNLITNQQTVNILYLSDDIEIGKMSPSVFDAFCTRFAVDIGNRILGESANLNHVIGMFGEKMITAKQQNDSQSSYIVDGSSWLEAGMVNRRDDMRVIFE